MIEIGFKKQLLLDDYLIESMIGVKRRLNPATKVLVFDWSEMIQFENIYRPKLRGERP